MEKLNKEVERVQKKLSNEGFVAKAPAKGSRRRACKREGLC